MSWAQVLLFSAWVFKAGTTNIYRFPETWPPLIGLPDALARLRTLVYPGLGASAWLMGGLLILGGMGLAWPRDST